VRDRLPLALLLVAALAAPTALSGPASAAATRSGCKQIVLGVAGMIRPESSGLTCRQIKRMNEAVSPGGTPYLVESPDTGLYWKCRTRGSRPAAPLLRCEREGHRFSIVAAPPNT
jgi:hypothetical protein